MNLITDAIWMPTKFPQRNNLVWVVGRNINGTIFRQVRHPVEQMILPQCRYMIYEQLWEDLK